MLSRIWERTTSVEMPTTRHYDSVAGRPFDHPLIEAFARPKVDWIFENISMAKPRILEVGAGNGYFSHQLSLRGELVATDISGLQLRFNPAPVKERSSVYHLPYADNTFDIVISSNLLHHLDTPERAVQEMTRVSRNYVVVSEPNNTNLIQVIGSLILPAERKGVLFSKRYVAKILSRNLTIQKHTYHGGMMMPNGTPQFLFRFCRPESRSYFSFFQIFVCHKLSAG
jgi:SAM-dependent methyltransferase